MLPDLDRIHIAFVLIPDQSSPMCKRRDKRAVRKITKARSGGGLVLREIRAAIDRR
jgi:hypothetical protein